MNDLLSGAEISDIRTVDLSTKTVSGGFEPEDTNYLIIFFPKVFTPVCKTELGAIEKWRPEFRKLGFEIIAGSVDPEEDILSWFEMEEALRDATYQVICSTELPRSLGLLRMYDELKRSSVFITNDGELVCMEHFNKVGRSFSELHRMAWGQSTGNYCTEGWQSPSDGFLSL